MKSSVINKAQSLRIITVKVNGMELKDFYHRALHKVQSSLSVKGFRKGRAPEDLVVKEVGEKTLEAEALDILLSDTYFLALKEHDLRPIAHPEIDLKVVPQTGFSQIKNEDEAVVVYEAKVSVMPEVSVKNIDRIKAKRVPATAPTEDEINKVIDHLRRQKALFKEVERPAQLSDWVDIGYEGSIDHVKKDQLANKNHPLILGENSLIPGFEAEVVGLNKGESKTFTITFPTDYHAQDVAGKKAEFTVIIHEVKEVVLPEFDATFTKDFGYDEPTKMTEAITKNLAQEKIEEAEQQLQSEVLGQLEKQLVADIPEAMYDEENRRMLTDLQQKVESQGLKWADYLTSVKHSEEQILKDLRPQAEKNVRLGLALGAIVKENKLPIKDEKKLAYEALDWLVKKATGESK
ncbi:MAG: trigger factor [bacterium]|nr:trigger factor [bacterium]